MMSHPYLNRRPPKTTGREEFGEMFLHPTLSAARRLRLPDADIIATITAFTAATIADHYRRFIFPRLKPAQLSKLDIILGGGGAKNPTLRSMLAERIGYGRLLTHEDFGIANAAKEALAFAILAYETLNHRPNNVPSATGARQPVVLGKIVPGNR
jgi:anhydro-N-acetylmuramic acid kinase